MLRCLGIVGTVFQQQQNVAFPYYGKKRRRKGRGGGERKEKENKNCRLFRECHSPTRRQNDFVFLLTFLPLRVTLYITLVLPS